MTKIIENGDFITQSFVLRDLLMKKSTLDDLIDFLDEESNYQISDCFKKIVNFFSQNNYIFGQLNDCLPDHRGNRVYLRYDVHIQDISSALILARLHNRLKVSGTFYITWDFSHTEIMSRDLFLSLKNFGSKYVKFGLHTAPACKWFAELLGYDDFTKCNRDIFNGIFDQDIINISNYCQTDDRFLDETVSNIQKIYRSQIKTFDKNFGFYKSVTGHGNRLTSKCTQLSKKKKINFSKFLTIVNPNYFFLNYGCRFSSVEYEATVFDGNIVNYNILFDGLSVDVLSEKILKRFFKNLNVFTVLHPAKFSRKLFPDIIEKTKMKLNEFKAK